MNIRFRQFHGPNLLVPFAAVVAEFRDPFGSKLAAADIDALWQSINGRPLGEAAHSALTLAELAAAIAVHLQHPEDAGQAKLSILRINAEGAYALALGFVEAESTRLALGTAIEFATAAFALARGAATPAPGPLARKLGQVRALLRSQQPQTPIIRTLLREARGQGIPVYPVAEGSRTWQFGQGAAGVHFHEAASEFDSFTGVALARDKYLSNRLVRRLGYPGVTHAVADGPQAAARIAARLGYPVVVKPIASGKGKGITAGIADARQLADAYAKAAPLSPGGVIVERHVHGDDHRLAVFGGKLAWVAARRPPAVTGDGRSTIAELIEVENRRRRDPALVKAGLLPLQADADMQRHLRNQGLSLADRPPAGAAITLRSIANVSQGGSVDDVTEAIHPDNRAMAEALARSFRMDALGVDFLTPDIGRSWREVPCAVIEVNGTPGMFFDERARRVLRARFPEGSDGRIPSLLLVAAPAGLPAQVAARLGARGLCVGQTDHAATSLGGQPRCRPGDDLAARLMALIADPACQALVVATSPEQLKQSGLPLDRFDLVLSFGTLQPALAQVLKPACAGLIDGLAPDVTDSRIESWLDAAQQIRPGSVRRQPHRFGTGQAG